MVDFRPVVPKLAWSTAELGLFWTIRSEPIPAAALGVSSGATAARRRGPSAV